MIFHVYSPTDTAIFLISLREYNTLRPRLHEYVFIEKHIVFIEKHIVFNENATIVLHLHIVFVWFSAVHTETMKTIDNGKNQRKSFFACQDNLNNLWLLLHNNIIFKSFHFGDHFQKLSFSVKTIIVLIVFVYMQGKNLKKSLRFR